jgi:soluble lytic murein transglycosylase-like protein
VSADGSNYVDVPTLEIEHFETAPADVGSGLRAPASLNRASGSGLAASAQQPQQPVDLNEVVAAASGRYRLDPDLVNSVIRAESGFNVRAVSPKGAQGLMQLMPGTASKLGVPNAFDAQANVEGGTRYLRELLERYDFDLIKALAAYNAGPRRVEQYGGLPPYYETHAYVARIVKDFNRKKLAQKNAARQASPATAKTSSRNAAKGKPKNAHQRANPEVPPRVQAKAAAPASE